MIEEKNERKEHPVTLNTQRILRLSFSVLSVLLQITGTKTKTLMSQLINQLFILKYVIKEKQVYDVGRRYKNEDASLDTLTGSGILKSSLLYHVQYVDLSGLD